MLVFMICVSGDALISDTNFNMEVGILLGQGEHSPLNYLVSLSTSSYVTQLSLKLFSNEYLAVSTLLKSSSCFAACFPVRRFAF